MQGLEEVLIVLVFIGIALVQFVTRRRARREPPRPAPPAPSAPPPAHVPARQAPPRVRASLEQIVPEIAPPRPPVPTPPQRQTPAVAPAVPPAPRRFSRASLFADRRAVQDSVVIATLLGPCRALEPPGSEGPAAVPRPGRR